MIPPIPRNPLPPEAHGITATRTSHSDNESTDISLEVDHMILDYFLHHAIQTCLDTSSPSPSPPSSHSTTAAISRVDDFLAIFTTRHSSYTPDPDLHFRQLLLQLLVLLTHRHQPTTTTTTPPLSSLINLRAENSSRAKAWVQLSAQHPTSPYNPSPFNISLPLDQTFPHRPPKTFTLLDLLPLFMKLSALACTTLYAGNINEQWMCLASEWILQACLEQFSILGVITTGMECIDEAFAWGYLLNGNESVVNTMFEEEELGREIEGWKEWKERRLNVLMTMMMEEEEEEEEGEGLERRLERLVQEFPPKEFETSLRVFLEALGKCIPEPVLLQLEKGKLEGISQEATRDFLRECGVVKEAAFAAML